ncbi:MAG: hypothetical protein AAB375_01250 [Patescibacteria group bacterium]
MEGPPIPPEKKETELGSYENALELFKKLKEEGINNPLDLENPKVQEAQDALNEYEQQAGIVNMTSGIGSIERAQELVRAARIILDAGFSGKATRADAKGGLDDLYAFALRENDPEVIAYISGEIERLEPKSKLDQMIGSKLAEAAAAAPTSAVGILTCLLFDPRFKRMSSEQRRAVELARDSYRR